MRRVSKIKLYVIITVTILVLCIMLLIRYLLQNRTVNAFVTPLTVFVNEPVHYTDSSSFAKQWLWEFGDSISYPSINRSGHHTFKESGVYRMKLTINNSVEKFFTVTVREKQALPEESFIKISAPYSAVQGEQVVFKGIGDAKDWKWSFGETGRIDSREKLAIYSFSWAGRYTVQLETENTKYPVYHTIQILPAYMDEEKEDEHANMGNDIKEKLQAIVDGKPFNPNYNYILQKYLCGNPNVLVTVNDSKINDFYSYCQGLKILGRNNTTIQNVIVFPDEKNKKCIKKLNVTQVGISNY